MRRFFCNETIRPISFAVELSIARPMCVAFEYDFGNCYRKRKNRILDVIDLIWLNCLKISHQNIPEFKALCENISAFKSGTQSSAVKKSRETFPRK
jgi:hypothetical protein